MNKTTFAIALILFASCVAEAVGGNVGKNPSDTEPGKDGNGPHIVFSASIESFGAKLSMAGKNPEWSVGDRITVIDASGNKSVYASSSAGASSRFEYVSGEGPVTAPFTAWYPSGIEDGYFPVAQTCLTGQVSCAPMKAVSSGKELAFRNLTGLVKVTLKGPHSNICALSFAADKAVSGFFDPSVEPGRAALSSGLSAVQLTLSEPVDISAAKDFYFAVAEGDYDSAQLTVLDTDGRLACYPQTGVSVTRSAVTEMPVTEVLSMGNDGALTFDLSSSTTANCYMPTRKSDYKFYARTKGGRGVSAVDFSPVSADILWAESSGGGVFDAILPVICYKGYVYFRKCLKSGETFHPGNAVVAVRDAAGRILWSWHLWMPEETSPDGSDLGSAYANAAGTVMSYNLGETSDKRDGGFFYQWGRKDPFPADYQSRSAFPAAVESSAETGTVEYLASHPMQFVYGTDESCYDWSYAASGCTAWGAYEGKGLYDPCPPGWHLPDCAGHGITTASRGLTPVNLSGLWPVAFGTGIGFFGKRPDNSPFWDSERKGISLPSSVSGNESWYAAGGFLNPEDGRLVEAGWSGSCWTRGAEESGYGVASAAFCMSFGASGVIIPATLSNKAAGRNVRCVKD